MSAMAAARLGCPILSGECGTCIKKRERRAIREEFQIFDKVEPTTEELFKIDRHMKVVGELFLRQRVVGAPAAELPAAARGRQTDCLPSAACGLGTRSGYLGEPDTAAISGGRRCMSSEAGGCCGQRRHRANGVQGRCCLPCLGFSCGCFAGYGRICCL